MTEGDRRNPELRAISERLHTVETKVSDMDKTVSGMNYALFGTPMDRTNNGLVGSMSELKDSMSSVKGTLNKILIAVICGVGIDAVARVMLHQ